MSENKPNGLESVWIWDLKIWTIDWRSGDLIKIPREDAGMATGDDAEAVHMGHAGDRGSATIDWKILDDEGGWTYVLANEVDNCEQVKNDGGSGAGRDVGQRVASGAVATSGGDPQGQPPALDYSEAEPVPQVEGREAGDKRPSLGQLRAGLTMFGATAQSQRGRPSSGTSKARLLQFSQEHDGIGVRASNTRTFL